MKPLIEATMQRILAELLKHDAPSFDVFSDDLEASNALGFIDQFMRESVVEYRVKYTRLSPDQEAGATLLECTAKYGILMIDANGTASWKDNGIQQSAATDGAGSAAER